MAIIINTVNSEYFTLNNTRYAKIYQPLKSGINNLGIYNVNDTKQQLLSSTHYSEFVIDSISYSSQTDTIIALLPVIYLGNDSFITSGGTISGDFLPLSGGTMTGDILMNNTNDIDFDISGKISPIVGGLLIGDVGGDDTIVKLIGFGGTGTVSIGDGEIFITGQTESNSYFQGTRFFSTESTGQSPFTVASTTKVVNLNADLLDGLESTSFLTTTAGGTITGSNLRFNDNVELNFGSTVHDSQIFSNGSDTIWSMITGDLILKDGSSDRITFERLTGDIIANSFIKSGGTANQFLKADGSVDSTVYGDVFSGSTNTFTLENDFNAGINLTAGQRIKWDNPDKSIIGGNSFTYSAFDDHRWKVWDGVSAYAEEMRLIQGGNLGLGVTAPTEKLVVSGNTLSDSYNLISLNTAPATTSSTGTLGEIRYTSTHMYLCTATDTWKRVALSTW